VTAEERVLVDARRHGVSLLGPLLRALALAAGGVLVLALPWPFLAGGPLLLAAAAARGLIVVWRWDRTRLVVTTEKVVLLQGTWRRRASAVTLRSLPLVGLEQTPLGRVLGYGTLVAGSLQIEYVPQARRVRDLIQRLAG
jgi:hypothetical protein